MKQAITNEYIIDNLVKSRENTLSVRRIEVKYNGDSLGNPCISVGTAPYYEWSKVKEMTFIITFGRYLNCEMVAYSEKLVKNDPDYIIVHSLEDAVKSVSGILNHIRATNKVA